MNIDIHRFHSIIKDNKNNKSSLISILQDIQAEYNWLPKEAITEVSKKLNIPLNDIYEVATFYKNFKLKPQPEGKHVITVCIGPACYVRGGQKILDAVSKILDIIPGETTSDMNFTIETANCLDCCAIGPVILIDGEYYGEMTPRKINSTLAKYIKDD